MANKTTFLLLLFVLAKTMIFGQPLQNKFRVIGKADGLPSLLNFNVYETSDGYFWIATQTGLMRYDGKTFEPFYAYFTDSNSITGNIVTDLQEDKRRQLWIGSFSAGMSTYHLETGQWKQYKHPTPDNNPIYRILDFFYDKEDRLWIGTGGRGLLQFDDHSRRFIQYIPDPSLPADGSDGNANTIREIADDPSDSDVLWLAAMDGLYRFYKSTGKFTRYENRKDGKKQWRDNCFHTILTQKNDTIWLGTWAGGLIQFNKRDKGFINYPMNKKEYERNNASTNIVADIFKISDSSLYIAARHDGLFEFIIPTKKYRPVITKETGVVSNDAIAVVGINKTSNGCIWISGMNNIYLQHPVYNRFGLLHKLHTGPPGKNIYPASLQDVLWLPETGKYWLAATSAGGVLEYDNHFNFIRSIPVSGYYHREFSANSIVKDGNGKIWLQVLESRYLYCFDPASGRFQTTVVPSGKTQGFIIDRENRIWTVSDSSLVQYDIGTGSLARFPIRPDEASRLKLPIFHAGLREDNQGNIWIASNIGLWKFDPDLKQWLHLYPDKQHPYSSLADPFVTCMTIGSSGQIWVATESQGLQVLDASNNKFIASHHVNGNSSFHSPQVNYIEVDAGGTIWAATNNGLGALRPGNNQWDWFDERDGIPKGYLDQPLFTPGNNKVILAQHDGFIAFDANNQEQNKFLPRMKLTGLLIDGENAVGVAKENKFTINYDKKRISFLFTAIEPVQPERLLYLYKLEGYDKDWQTTILGNVQYTGLAAGNYTFIIKAGINNGLWSGELRVPVIILSPFWKKWWFILAMIMIALGLLYATYRYRIRQLLQLQSIRNDISRDLHDELGSTVSSMNMLTMVARKQMDEAHPAYDLLSQIGQSAQQAGESIDEIIWSINAGQDSALATMNRIRSYVSGLFESVGIVYEIEFKEIPENLRLGKDLSRDIWLVCKEAVNNIIKFSQCKKVSLLIEYKKNFLDIYITDDGKGFDLQQALLNGRNGLKNMESRTKKYKKGIFRIVTHPGTRIYCRLPVKNDTKM